MFAHRTGIFAITLLLLKALRRRLRLPVRNRSWLWESLSTNSATTI